MRHLILFMVLLVLLETTNGADLQLPQASAQTEDFWPFHQPRNVVIINDLPDNMDLTVHCKSKDDDLGIQVLPPQGRFQFHFHPSVWGNTLFFCGFQWNGAFHRFDIYVQKRDVNKCYTCLWSITPNGPCMLDSTTGKYDWCNGWNPPSSS